MVSISQISGNLGGEGGGEAAVCILSIASFESGKYNLILENFILVIHVSNITIHIFKFLNSNHEWPATFLQELTIHDHESLLEAKKI